MQDARRSEKALETKRFQSSMFRFLDMHCYRNPFFNMLPAASPFTIIVCWVRDEVRLENENASIPCITIESAKDAESGSTQTRAIDPSKMGLEFANL
jgi:hypothetical protein